MLVIISNSLLDAELYDSRGCVLSGVSVLLNLIETDRQFRKNVCIKKNLNGRTLGVWHISFLLSRQVPKRNDGVKCLCWMFLIK